MEVPSLSSNGFPLQLLGVALVLLAIMDLTQGYDFYAGGRDAWLMYPSESYTHWAERNRFQVNDSVVFEYEKGKDSVLVVPEHDFYSCNLGKPLRLLAGGNDRFTFSHSGPFFFVSGASGKCELVQKLEVVIMAILNPLSGAKSTASCSGCLWQLDIACASTGGATCNFRRCELISSLGIVIDIAQFVLLIQIL